MIWEILLVGVGGCIFVGIIALGYGIHVFNYLNSGKINIEAQWSNIKTEYQRRFDLLPNLAEAVKSFRNHEAKTYLNVSEARSMVNFKGSKAQTMKSMNFLDSFFSRLMVANERYPELKAKLHEDLMLQVRITEDRINVSRTDYNDVVREYNMIVRTFPSNIIANMFRFSNEQMFELQQKEAELAPRLKLD
jgi:LemA protein